jgi:8-oxo-dGTP pyrophosphatase MutT (NUDIX family)
MTEAAIPRLAATVLLIRDDPFEVLMVRRSAAGSFPSAMVFPGGTVDASDRDEAWLPLLDGAEGLDPDERGLRIAALRETFEEVGLFVAIDAAGQAASPAACEETDFRALVAASNARLPIGSLAHFAQWVTPAISPKRWDTHFFLARAPHGQIAVCDEHETMAPEWLAPATALAMAEAGAREIVSPTRANLHRLAESDTVDTAFAAAAARPRFIVHPQVQRRADGMYTVIPAEAGYGFTDMPRNKVSNV